MLPVVVLLVGSVISWLRVPREARGVVWAEDGWAFLQTWLNHPGDSHLLDVYEGYLHVVPRFVVQLVATVLPAPWFGHGVTVACCVVVGGLAAVTYSCSATVLRTVPARLALAGIPVLAPAAPQEVLGNAANLHSYFMWVVPWVLLHRPGSRRSSWLLGGLALAAALTEVQVALFVPLLWLAVRDRGRWPVAGGLLLGVAAQAVSSLVSPRSPNLPLDLSFLARVKGFLVDAVLSTTTALDQGVIVRDWGWWVPLALLAVLLALTAATVVWGGSGRGLAAVTVLAAAVAAYGAAVTLNPNPLYAYDLYGALEWTNYRPPRYAVVPAMFLTAAMVLGADSLLAPERTRVGRLMSGLARLVPRREALRVRVSARSGRLLGWAVLSAAVVLQASSLFPGVSLRVGGDPWAGQVERRAQACHHRAPDARVRISLAPTFGVVVTTCRRLTSWAD